MPITITFPNPINVSVQIGDGVYYTNTTTAGGFTHDNSVSGGTGLVYMGPCTAVTANTISCEIANSTPRPTSSSFICFAKDTRLNRSGLTGYFAEVEMRNDDYVNPSEMFMVSSEIAESSK